MLQYHRRTNMDPDLLICKYFKACAHCKVEKYACHNTHSIHPNNIQKCSLNKNQHDVKYNILAMSISIKIYCNRTSVAILTKTECWILHLYIFHGRKTSFHFGNISEQLVLSAYSMQDMAFQKKIQEAIKCDNRRVLKGWHTIFFLKKTNKILVLRIFQGIYPQWCTIGIQRQETN